jgi:hypothetical protein
MSDDPQAFELEAAYQILERAHLLLAPRISGCTVRRYTPPVRNDGAQLLLCFADAGPIVPILTISPLKYGTLGQAHFWYGLTLWQDGVRQGLTFPYVLGDFTGAVVKGLVRLDSDPEAIAETMLKALAPYDLKAMVAAATPERILANRPPRNHVWQYFMLALCAIYERQYGEAEELLRDYFSLSDDNERGWIWSKVFATSTEYAAGLKSDPDGVRDKVVAVMQDNWNHLKIVRRAGEDANQ